MRRSQFRDDPNPRGRIDARPPSKEKAAGMRNIHRDTDGSVIGGVMPDGTPTGSRARQTGPLMNRLSLGKPVTPGLDAQAAANANAPGGAANLAGRQALKADMDKAGSGGLTPEMEARATTLGVSGSAFRRVAAGIPQAPGMLAANPPVRPAAVAAVPAQAATGTPSPVPMVAIPAARPTPFRQPGASATPLTGGALATANIARMGQAGAVADFMKRDAADKEKLAASQARGGFRRSVAPPVPISGTAAPGTSQTFEKAAGLPAKTPQQAVAARFAAPAATNFQAVATPPKAPVVASPPAVSQFQQLTNPAPVTAKAQVPVAKPTSTFRTPTKLTDKNPVSFVGNTPAGPTREQRAATAQAAAVRDPNNKPLPAWMQGTAAGGLLERLSKPLL